LITAAFLVLGINKQLNLLPMLTETGRATAKLQGWYGQRQSVQIAFVAMVAVSCGIAAVMLVTWARKAPVSTWWALIGSTTLIGYVVIQAASLHYFDRLIDTKVLSFPLNWIFEMGGIGVVLLASFWRQSKLGKPKPRSLRRS
jgi:phosphate/sulfate permease